MISFYLLVLGLGWIGILYTLLLNLFRLWVDPDSDFPRVNIPISVKIVFAVLSVVIVVCLTNVLRHIF